VFASASIAACAGTKELSSQVSFTGSTHADEVLKADTLKIIRAFLKAKKCEEISHVDVKALFYEPTNRTKGHI
jgi:hypothetical protein